MSSFKARLAQRAKQQEKAGQGNAPVPEAQGESVAANEGLEATHETQAFYGEDQHERQGADQKPTWQRDIPLTRIRPNPFQPRKTFDSEKLAELANGMREHGWIGGGLPVRVQASEPNTYELVWGERRWRAARMAGLTAIPCVVSPYTDNDMIEAGLLENIQREDLNKLEEGQAYTNLLALRTEEGKPRYSIRRLAQRIGKDKSYIEDRLLYARVPVDIQQLALDQPDISPRIIRELGELAKMLAPEERTPVLEGVRSGQLRIEDVHTLRKDVEQQVKRASPPLTTEQAVVPAEQRASTTEVPVGIFHSQDSEREQPSPEVNQQAVSVSRLVRSVSQATIEVGVFEKTLKRDDEALERMVRRIMVALETMSEDEQQVLKQYVQRWNITLQALMSRVEQE